MSRLGDGGGGDGFHRLYGHGGAEEDAGGDVVEGGEDEGGGEIEIHDERQRENDGDVSAEVADGAAQLGEEGSLEAEGGRDAAAHPVDVPGEERCGGCGLRRVVGHVGDCVLCVWQCERVVD